MRNGLSCVARVCASDTAPPTQVPGAHSAVSITREYVLAARQEEHRVDHRAVRELGRWLIGRHPCIEEEDRVGRGRDREGTWHVGLMRDGLDEGRGGHVPKALAHTLVEVPPPDRVVERAREHRPRVRRPAQARHMVSVLVEAERLRRLDALDGPTAHAAVEGARGEQPAIGREGHRVHGAAVAAERARLLKVAAVEACGRCTAARARRLDELVQVGAHAADTQSRVVDGAIDRSCRGVTLAAFGRVAVRRCRRQPRVMAARADECRVETRGEVVHGELERAIVPFRRLEPLLELLVLDREHVEPIAQRDRAGAGHHADQVYSQFQTQVYLPWATESTVRIIS